MIHMKTQQMINTQEQPHWLWGAMAQYPPKDSFTKHVWATRTSLPSQELENVHKEQLIWKFPLHWMRRTGTGMGVGKEFIFSTSFLENCARQTNLGSSGLAVLLTKVTSAQKFHDPEFFCIKSCPYIVHSSSVGRGIDKQETRCQGIGPK